MLCYKDMTFCESDCTNENFRRFLSDDVWRSAQKCRLLVAVCDFSKDCEDYEDYEYVNPISSV